jgi:hypothetical protein
MTAALAYPLRLAGNMDEAWLRRTRGAVLLGLCLRLAFERRP